MGGQADLSYLPISLNSSSQPPSAMKLTALMRGGAGGVRESEPWIREHINTPKKFHFNSVTQRGQFNLVMLSFAVWYGYYRIGKFLVNRNKKKAAAAALGQ